MGKVDQSFQKKIGFFLILIVGWLFVFGCTHVYAEEKSGEHDRTPPAEDAHGGDAQKNDKASGVTGGRFVGDPIYVHLDPLVLPIITEDGVQQIITMLITIEVTDYNTVDDIHSNIPRVRDAMMMSIYGGLSDGSLREGNMINLAKVKEKFLVSVRQAVNTDKISGVLVEGMAQRMF